MGWYGLKHQPPANGQVADVSLANTLLYGGNRNDVPARSAGGTGRQANKFAVCPNTSAQADGQTSLLSAQILPHRQTGKQVCRLPPYICINRLTNEFVVCLCRCMGILPVRKYLHPVRAETQVPFHAGAWGLRTCPPAKKCTFSFCHTLKRNRTTSPSCTTYSFPSERTSPFSLAPLYPS